MVGQENTKQHKLSWRAVIRRRCQVACTTLTGEHNQPHVTKIQNTFQVQIQIQGKFKYKIQIKSPPWYEIHFKCRHKYKTHVNKIQNTSQVQIQIHGKFKYKIQIQIKWPPWEENQSLVTDITTKIQNIFQMQIQVQIKYKYKKSNVHPDGRT